MEFSDRQKELGSIVLNALRQHISALESRGLAISYSGGLDSTVLLALLEGKAKPYTLGSADSRDLENSSKGSEATGVSVERIDLDSIDIEEYLSLLREIDPEIRKQDMGYELVLAVILDSIPEERIVTGQGADELFYGYHRFIDEPELTNSGHMEKLFSKTLPRERALAEHFGKTLVTPYLDPTILEAMEGTTREDHFSGDFNKAIVRYIGLEAGLPESIVYVKKKAAQYGSGMMKKLRENSIWSTL